MYTHTETRKQTERDWKTDFLKWKNKTQSHDCSFYSKEKNLEVNHNKTFALFSDAPAPSLNL